MRTTLTLDDDVAAAVERVRKSSDSGLMEIINDALRRGLKDTRAGPKRTQPFRTKSIALGRIRLARINNISGALALAPK